MDLDGTIYLGNRLIEGAREAVYRMRRADKRVIFLTNNSSVSRKDYFLKLRAMGLAVEENDIYTSGNATAAYLKAVHPDKRIYLFGTPNLRYEFMTSGIEPVEDNPDVVAVAFDTAFNYQKLCKVCDYIRGGAYFVATHPDLNCPTADGFIPDVGSVLALIKASTGRVPDTICGKPEKIMARCIEQLTGLGGKKIAMVGDRLMTDIRFAKNNGFASVLVLSGETDEEMLAAGKIKPDVVLPSIGEWDK